MSMPQSRASQSVMYCNRFDLFEQLLAGKISPAFWRGYHPRQLAGFSVSSPKTGQIRVYPNTQIRPVPSQIQEIRIEPFSVEIRIEPFSVRGERTANMSRCVLPICVFLRVSDAATHSAECTVATCGAGSHRTAGGVSCIAVFGAEGKRDEPHDQECRDSAGDAHSARLRAQPPLRPVVLRLLPVHLESPIGGPHPHTWRTA